MTSIYPSSTSSNTNSSTSGKNLLRISGMASGIDTDSVVKSMVSNYQAKIDKANKEQQLVQWKQSGYRDIIKGIKGLQDYFDPLSSKYILGDNSMNINAATSDTNSVATATVGNSAKVGTYSVNVTQLASQAVISGTANDSLISTTSLITSGKSQKLIDSNGNTLVDLSGLSGNSADLAKQINAKIASSSLNGKVSAAYVGDAAGNGSIKFTNLTTDTTIKYSDSIPTVTQINSGISSSSKLASSGLGIVANGGNMSFSLSDGGKNYNVSLAVDNNTTIQNLIDTVNSATSGAITMKIDDTTGAISFQSKNSGSSSSISIADTSTGSNKLSQLGITSTSYTGTTTVATDGSTLLSSLSGFAAGSMNFTINNKTVSLTVDATTTVNALKTAINGSGSGATMSIDGTGKVSISSAANITNITTGSNNNIISLLGLNIENNQMGKDAVVAIKEPGQTSYTTTTQSSNNFTVNGVSYNLVGVSPSSNSTGDANVTVSSNADNVVTNIKSFIADYNTLIGTINTKLTEKKDNAYPPLTDDQKSSMSESQITAWEAKAKVGVLRNDDYLSQLMTEVRGVFSSAVYNSYSSSNGSSGKIGLSFGQYGSNAIGIDTSSDVTDGGKLILKDETKLKNAITNNFDDFKKLFTGVSSISTLPSNQTYIGSKKYMEDGIFKRMDNILRGYVAAPGIGKDGTYSLTGTMNIFVNKQYDFSSTGSGGKNTLPDQVYSKTSSISKLKTQMSAAETRYYNKFTALETAMNKLNSQQSQLSSMLGTN